MDLSYNCVSYSKLLYCLIVYKLKIVLKFNYISISDVL